MACSMTKVEHTSVRTRTRITSCMPRHLGRHIYNCITLANQHYIIFRLTSRISAREVKRIGDRVDFFFIIVSVRSSLLPRKEVALVELYLRSSESELSLSLLNIMCNL